MTELERLKAELAVRQAQLARDQARATKLAGQIVSDEARVEDLKRRIAALEAGQAALLCWPHGQDAKTLDEIETELAAEFDGGRPRGGFGQFLGKIDKAKGLAIPDGVDELIKAGFPSKTRAGSFFYSTNLNPRVGTGQAKYPILWADVNSGRLDAAIRARLEECKAWGQTVQIEWASEYTTDHGAPSAQPMPPDVSNGPAAFHRFRTIRDEIGASNVLIGISIAGTDAIWKAGGTADRVLTPMLADADFIGSDRYNHAGQELYPRDMFAGFFDWANRSAPDHRLAICETGCQEQGDQGAFKAAWIRGLVPLVQTAPVNLISVTLNHGDYPTGGFNLNTSPAALEAARETVLEITGRPI